MGSLHHVLWQQGKKKPFPGRDRLPCHGDNPYNTKLQAGKVKDSGEGGTNAECGRNIWSGGVLEY